MSTLLALTAYLHTAYTRLADRVQELRDPDTREEGSMSTETAILAAGLIGLALIVMAAIAYKVNQYISQIK